MNEEWLNWVPLFLRKAHYGNRQTETAMASSDTVRELDTLDSLYFDVSVASHRV
jgi:hypothetical protein